MSFARAIAFVLAHEGEWSDHPNDRGARTRWGLSSAAHPDLDLDTLTREQAVEIYRREYWTPIQGERLPPDLGLVLLDHAVHAGVAAAVRTLQHNLGVRVDGCLGPQTLGALAQRRRSSLPDLARACLHQRARDLVHQGTTVSQRAFLLGWVRRLIDLALAIG